MRRNRHALSTGAPGLEGPKQPVKSADQRSTLSSSERGGCLSRLHADQLRKMVEVLVAGVQRQIVL
jgi:hypothetical protein